MERQAPETGGECQASCRMAYVTTEVAPENWVFRTLRGSRRRLALQKPIVRKGNRGKTLGTSRGQPA
jgi:hypothetical protein